MNDDGGGNCGNSGSDSNGGSDGDGDKGGSGDDGGGVYTIVERLSCFCINLKIDQLQLIQFIFTYFNRGGYFNKFIVYKVFQKFNLA